MLKYPLLRVAWCCEQSAVALSSAAWEGVLKRHAGRVLRGRPRAAVTLPAEAVRLVPARSCYTTQSIPFVSRLEVPQAERFRALLF